MKVGLLLNANIYLSPYVKIYSKILDELKVDYDLLAWDRIKIGEKTGVIYKRYFPYGTKKKIIWVINYYAYSIFLKKHIKVNQYDRLVVFGPQIGLFLLAFFKLRYKRRICFDFRDIFIDQMFPKLFHRLLSISSLNVISSNGFRSYLPKEFEYTLCHNFNIDIVNDSINKISDAPVFNKIPITIMTIGEIRNYEQNYQLMKELSNNPYYLIKFIGNPGKAGLKLKQDSIENNFNNVEFLGHYEKKDEPSLIKDADFLNIYYPPTIGNKTAMSNRFYNALIYKKPIIALKDSTQGMYVEKYKLGIVIKSCSNLNEQIQEFVSNFNKDEFNQNCIILLKEFRNNYEIFRNKFIDFLKA
jgi:hypothetical protein